MGNSQSRNNSPSHREMSRKPSVPILRHKSSCHYTPYAAASASTPAFSHYPSTPAFSHLPPLPPKDDVSLSTQDEKRGIHEPSPIYTITLPTTDYTPDDPSSVAYKAFLKEYPQYQLTWPLDVLRRTDFARIDRAGETYVDYMGGALYPDSLVQVHANFLQRSVLGNTHSINNS